MAKRMRAAEIEERARNRGRRLSSVGQAAIAAERMTELEEQRAVLLARVNALEAQLGTRVEPIASLASTTDVAYSAGASPAP